MQYIVVTSKHHDGFAMYHSEVDSYNVVDATPFGRDVIGEIAEACRKHDLKLGIYYSQNEDWHDPNGGGYGRGPYTNCGMSCSNGLQELHIFNIYTYTLIAIRKDYAYENLF